MQFQTPDIVKPDCIKEVTVSENQYVRVNMDILRFPDGETGTHLKVYHQNEGGVVAIVLNEKRQLYLQHGYHYAANVTQLEFIRGFANANETRIGSVKREVAEEILYPYEVTSNPTLLGKIHPDSTLLNQSVDIYLIEIVAGDKLTRRQDAQESLGNGAFYTIEKLESLICLGKINDSFTLSGYALLKSKSLLNGQY